MLLRFIEYCLTDKNCKGREEGLDVSKESGIEDGLADEEKVPMVEELEPKYLKVSSLIVLADELQFDRLEILKIWIQLFEHANLELCCNKLTSIGKLDYIFDVIQHFVDRNELMQSSGNCCQLIIEGFKEALESSQFFIAVKLMAKYEYILQINMSQLSQPLINCILDNPFFMEVKLRLIESSIHLFDFESMKAMLQAFEKIVRRMKSDPNDNILIYNQQMIMVTFCMYKVTQEINKYCPRINTRIVKLQNDILATNIAFAEQFQLTPVVVAQCLKLRDYQGRSIMTLFLETQVYEYLQVKSIEEAIKTLWLGKVNIGG